RDLDGHVGLGDGLAGQQVALLELLLGHGVVDEVPGVEGAGVAEGLAGAAGAVPAVRGDVDARLVGGVEDGLVVADLDDLRDAGLGAEGYLVAYDFLLGGGRRRRGPWEVRGGAR